MIKGSQKRHAEHPIHLMLIDRWSPRAMSGQPVSKAELMLLFEAARWAPSSMNFQPWRMLYALRDTAPWPVFFGLLNERNRGWAQHAGALVLFTSKKSFDDGRPCVTHSFDSGAAWQNFALQGFQSGLAVHGMQGFDYERARVELKVPDDFAVEAMIAVGKPGDKSALPEPLQARESPNERRPIEQTVREGAFTFD